MQRSVDPSRNGHDARLVALVARGDRSALADAYRELKDDLYSAACHLLGDTAAAEDVLQDVFVSFAAKAGSVRLRGTLRQYLATACLNRARDLLRRRKRGPGRVADPDGRPGTTEGPADRAARRDEALAVRRALAELPAKQREVVVLRTYGRLTFREVAETLGISINTAQSRHRYAMAGLRERLTMGAKS